MDLIKCTLRNVPLMYVSCLRNTEGIWGPYPGHRHPQAFWSWPSSTALRPVFAWSSWKVNLTLKREERRTVHKARPQHCTALHCTRGKWLLWLPLTLHLRALKGLTTLCLNSYVLPKDASLPAIILPSCALTGGGDGGGGERGLVVDS